MICVARPEGDAPEEARGMFQAILDQAYANVSSYIEQDIAGREHV